MEIKRIVVGPLQTNCYIVFSQKEGFIIDPGEDAEEIKDYIDIQKLKINFIINTHFHIDHIKADCDLGYPVYIHQLDAPLLENPKNIYFSNLFGDFRGCKPAKKLSDKDIIKLNELEIEIIHTPGHTPGGICLKIGNVIFTGDTLFKGGIGRTDFPGGSYEALISSIKNRLLCFDDDVKIYPGHGESSTIGKERNNL